MTKPQKTQILEAYKAGDSTNLIAKNYNCTPNTINRTVKSLLSETEYTLLKKNRAKISNKTEKLVNNNVEVNILHDDIELFYQSRLVQDYHSRDFEYGSMGGYYTFDEIGSNTSSPSYKAHKTYSKS